MNEFGATVAARLHAVVSVFQHRRSRARRPRHDGAEHGAATLEYVVIAAAVFVAAVALVGVVVGVIEREQGRIQ